MTGIHRIASVFAFLPLLLLLGCGTLPDARPFAEATSAFASGVKTAGTAISDTIEVAREGAPNPGDYEQLKERFSQAWSVRVTTANAAVVYANAIAEVTVAGSSGSETAGNVADALKDLATAAGASVGAPAVGVSVEIVQLIYKQIALVKSSDALDQALTKAQPAIDWVAKRIGQESEKQLLTILNESYKIARRDIRRPYDEDENFALWVRKQVTVKRAETQSDPKLLPQLQELDRVEAMLAGKIQERDQRLNEAANAYKIRRRLLIELSEAADSWAQAHRDLAASIKVNRQVNVSALLQSVSDVRALIKKVEDL